MSTLELAELLNQEMVENPLLEEVPTEELQPAEQQQAEKPEAEKPARRRTTPGTTPTTSISSASTSTTATGRGSRRKSRSCRRSRTRSRPKGSLADHLMWQLNLQTERRPAARDRRARSSATSTTTAIWSRRSTRSPRWATGTVADVERALEHVQTFDPIGVAARDLQECLLLQIRHLGLEGTPSRRSSREHLRLLQNHQVPEIARKLGMSSRRSRSTSRSSSNLDPKPGSRYNPAAVAVRHPRRLHRQDRGQYVAVLNEDGLPQLRISPVYRRLLDKGGEDVATRRAPT